MVHAMEDADPAKYPHDFAIAREKVFLGEGGTNQSPGPSVQRYFADVFQVLRSQGLAGIQLWVTDTLADAIDGTDQPTLSTAALSYDLFTTEFTKAGVRTYGSLPPGTEWHGSPAKGASYANPASFPASSGNRPAAYGRWSFTGLTDKGRWVQQDIADSKEATVKR